MLALKAAVAGAPTASSSGAASAAAAVAASSSRAAARRHRLQHLHPAVAARLQRAPTSGVARQQRRGFASGSGGSGSGAGGRRPQQPPAQPPSEGEPQWSLSGMFKRIFGTGADPNAAAAAAPARAAPSDSVAAAAAGTRAAPGAAGRPQKPPAKAGPQFASTVDTAYQQRSAASFRSALKQANDSSAVSGAGAGAGASASAAPDAPPPPPEAADTAGLMRLLDTFRSGGAAVRPADVASAAAAAVAASQGIGKGSQRQHPHHHHHHHHHHQPHAQHAGAKARPAPAFAQGSERRSAPADNRFRKSGGGRDDARTHAPAHGGDWQVRAQRAAEPGPGVYVRTLTDADDTAVPVPPTATPAQQQQMLSHGVLQVVATPPERNMPVPMLAAPIRKLLFTPDRRLLRKELLADPNAGASLPRAFTTIDPISSINMDVFAPFVTSSRDPTLLSLAQLHRCRIMGSTSSLTSLLSQLQFLFTGFRPVDTRSVGGRFSAVFESMPDNFTTAARKPATVVLRRRLPGDEDAGHRPGPVPAGVLPVWGVDNPPHGEPLPNQVLVELGKIMERWFTLEPEAFANAMLKERRSPTNRQEQEPHEPSLFVKMNSLMLRSQLDCCDPDMPGERKVFDLKTRATLPIRLDCANYRDYTSYGLFKVHGMFSSFEREWYDMARSAFLKYSLQCRIGHMNGVVVAYHNTQQVFGLEYIPLEEMDRLTFGSTAPLPSGNAGAKQPAGASAAGSAGAPSAGGNDGKVLADKSFARTLRILDDILLRITDEFKDHSCIKLTFDSHRTHGLSVYVELLPPVERMAPYVEALRTPTFKKGKRSRASAADTSADTSTAALHSDPYTGDATRSNGAPDAAPEAAGVESGSGAAEAVDMFSDPYSAALRVDAMSTADMRAALTDRFKKSAEGPRAVLASRLESALGLHDDMPEAPTEYYNRLARSGYLFKYHVGLSNTLNGKEVTGPFDHNSTTTMAAAAAAGDAKGAAATKGAACSGAKAGAKAKGMISTVDPDGWIAAEIHKEMYAESRRKLIAAMTAKLGGAGATSAPGHAVVLTGGTTLNKYDTDHEFVFRQESHFYYLFGCPEPDCMGAIDLATQQTLLFIPRLGVEYAVWCGTIKPCDFYAQKYGVDACRYVDELAAVLHERKLTTVHSLAGTNTDSGNSIPPLHFKGLTDFKSDTALLYPLLCECRVIKSARELKLMKYINKVSSDAHVQVMREVKHCKSEHELEAIFQYHAYRWAGCRHMSYTCICCSGENGAVLHYGHAGAPNDKRIEDGDMLLLDMGAEYHGYASDITCSYPANGKFTEPQRLVFEAVRAAQVAVLSAMKPGVLWSDMHRLAERTILEHLVAMGLVVVPSGVTLDDVHRKHHIAALFMPHGLGHLLGLDTHDVGGYPDGEAARVNEPGVRKLRTNRILRPGMVLTVEPGVYFIDALLTPALAKPEVARFLNAAKIKQYMSFGGVRLEDDVIVTETGCENMTQCPRTVAEVEAVMAGGAWPPLPTAGAAAAAAKK